MTVFREFMENYNPAVTEGIEEAVVNGYTVRYFIEDSQVVGGMVLMAGEEVCMITAEGFVIGELPNPNEFVC